MKKYISEKEFRFLLIKLFQNLNEKGEKYRFLYGIENGGLNVSWPVATFFGILHKQFKISFYDGEKKLKTPNISGWSLDSMNYWRNNSDQEGYKFLWVDDIVDSGSTLKWFIDNTGLIKGKDFDVASIHWCKDCSPDLQPEYFVDVKDKNDWIVYPWEV